MTRAKGATELRDLGPEHCRGHGLRVCEQHTDSITYPCRAMPLHPLLILNGASG